MTHLDDLLRRVATHPTPPAGFVSRILARVMEAEEQRGLLNLLSSTLLVSLSSLLSFHLLSLASLEVVGGKWRELLGGFYEEPWLFLSREGWLALLEHLLRGNVLFFIIALIVFALAVRWFLRVLSSFPPRPHVPN
jgi:hypothetical protein